MTITTQLPQLYSQGQLIDPQQLGWLRDSSSDIQNAAALRQRMKDEGYLFLPGLLNREVVMAARQSIANKLAAAKYLAPQTDPIDCIADQKYDGVFKPELAQDDPHLMKVVYNGPMMEFFANFLGAQVRHYDYTWLRAVAPGQGTKSHCDVVYMGRGTTTSLYTAWTPLGDVDFITGGLMLLEGSHLNQRLKDTYGKYDVDTFCANRPEINGWKQGGALTGNPNQVRRSVGGRWLTSEYRMGDVLIFTPYTIHASLDNHSRQIRLSSDTRYQRADEPVDTRWVGENPPGHGPAAKRGRIC